MKITQIRNATIIVDYSNTKFLIDPWLMPKDYMPGFDTAINSEIRQPRVELPFEIEKIVDVDAVIITHIHPDHWDEFAEKSINKDMKIFVQSDYDKNYIQSKGFKNVEILSFEGTKYNNITLFACSMGAYFSLLSYKNEDIKQSLFLSPVVNMKIVIDNMMKYFNVDEDSLEKEKVIETPINQKLYWDYYCYVKKHPIDTWNSPTSILYGSKDDVSDREIVIDFSKRFNCNLTIMNDGEHYFHTKEQLKFFELWIENNIK